MPQSNKFVQYKYFSVDIGRLLMSYRGVLTNYFTLALLWAQKKNDTIFLPSPTVRLNLILIL